MRKYTVVFVLSVFIFAGCGSQKDLTSHYAAEPVHVDGNISEWMDKLSYDKGQSIYYSVANDNSNLYLVLMTNDQVVQRKIMGLGLTLWFDNEGKKNKTKGIRYPLKPDRNSFSSQNAQSMQEPKRPNLNTMELVGFEGKEVQRVSMAERSPVDVKINHSPGQSFVYEVEIPLEKIFESGIDSTSKLSVGIETGYLELDNMSGNAQSGIPRAGSGGMRGIRPASRMGMRSGMNRGTLIEKMKTPTKLWLKGIQLKEKADQKGS
jgi:hypothetical protein